METWFIIVVTLCVSALLRSLFRPNHRNKLPPGPSSLSSTLLLLTNSLSELEPILKNLRSKYGPLITLTISSRPSIFVATHSLAHQILIQKGAVFSDRPRTLPVRNISSSAYGATWRLFRRNLASEMLHPARVKSYSWARKWVLHILINRLRDQGASGIKVIDHFQHAMFCLLVFMCFGEKLDEDRINAIASVQRRLLLLVGSGRFNILGVFPRLGRLLFLNRWKDLMQIRKDQEQSLLPLIESRIESVKSGSHNEGIVAYVDTLVNLELPEEDGGKENGGKLTHKEMVSICGEFLNAGTDTTSTALQWIMANLVKYPHIQSKLYDEIVSVVGPPPSPPREEDEMELDSVINEEDLLKMPYLKAVVLEGLRRHPPAHFVLPHRVMKEVEVQGYTIPQGATINFMVGEMGLDPNVWDEPLEFKPERFLVNDGAFDITGSKGIKMMPFGAGRRICPGSDLALLHLEYFVANLIWYFNWSVPDGYHVDLSDKTEFTVVMKNPLQAQVSSRVEKISH
ncbi:putative cytochrome P450 [Helianthus debilis subsp. tardiflorus]